MNRRLFLGTAAAVATSTLALLPGCTPSVTDQWPESSGPKIVAAFAPIQCFAMNVAGDDAVVRAAMTTQGPHHFEPGPADVRMLAQADLMFMNGLMLDDQIIKKLASGSGNKKLKLINLGAKLPESLLIESDHDHDHHGHAHHDHEHGEHDPHIWMGIPQAVKMVEGIRDELMGHDPGKASQYSQRAEDYLGKLQSLQEEGKALLKDKQDRKILTFHESLNYFAASFDLTIAGVIEDVPGSEPTPKQLEAIIAKCVKHNVRVIAVEPQYTSKTAAEQIVKELKTRGIADPVMVVIDPLETATAEEMKPTWYVDKMRANLEALAGALR